MADPRTDWAEARRAARRALNQALAGLAPLAAPAERAAVIRAVERLAQATQMDDLSRLRVRRARVVAEHDLPDPEDPT